LSCLSAWQTCSSSFCTSTSHIVSPFEIVHCDVWTSPVPSISGYSYYLVLLDDFSHFCWTFPLHRKSDVHGHLVDFIAYARTQFGLPIKCFQANNGTEFVNKSTITHLAAHGILFRLLCPCTSPQNSKTERVLRTLNNSMRTLLIHASMPPPYWAKALAVATYLLNCRPSSVGGEVSYTRLHCTPPSYDHLCIFGCLCYPNLQATSPHKLAPLSTACVFVGYPSSHKGYRSLDLSTRRIIISRHVVFDEFSFPFARDPPVPQSSLDFLLDDVLDIVHCPTNHATGSTRLSSTPTSTTGVCPQWMLSVRPQLQRQLHPPWMLSTRSLLLVQAGMVSCPRPDLLRLRAGFVLLAPLCRLHTRLQDLRLQLLLQRQQLQRL